ncbi:hypothetical protein TVAG_312120 [Trichomonas vaginalis G3]|uniref:BACK domain-containing protein n=1 Tax=Trichomonas vaginalis (strain ATCC PRA-98 / G3) TaxID=412133 RepID=A2EHL7_TRIV3|nr:spectrin binding [Trichomonas vaginalis G3]EAY07813.1 hypothetical protein TVAG_312120 [Trichomonas vaginalis G3]KAI5553423.1 spectrin binding [Trichomonas vaginalis G3]|eukprot:XP_001320036.1 hypothetical protein [Trichomonas vaginalis G3]
MVLIQLNNQILQRINNYQALDKVILSINNVEITLTKSFAVAISQTFYSQYLLDNNIAKIDIHTDVKSQETYNVLKDILQYNKTDIECDETILNDLFHIGIILEMQELTYLYKMHVIDKMKIDNNNCIDLLEFYFDISSQENIIECIKYISSNFYAIDSNKLKLISNKLGIDILQQIFSSDELLLEDEDSLANFIISLTKENEKFYPLIENIHFEFCNEQVIKSMKDIVDLNNYHCVVNSLSDSLLRSRNPKSKDRILQCENKTNYFKSGNVEMSASSIGSGHSIDVINKYRTDTYFKTENIPNSWVQWKLKQNIAIQPTEYIVRTFHSGISSYQLQTWKVEGTTINGETKIIHEVNKSPLNAGEIRKYSLNTNDKFISFKLIQTGKIAYSSPNDSLRLDVFDFSGKIFSK